MDWRKDVKDESESKKEGEKRPGSLRFIEAKPPKSEAVEERVLVSRQSLGETHGTLNYVLLD